MNDPCPIIFDLDGTLIDSAPDIHACVNAVLEQNAIATLSLEQIRSFVGGGVDLLWTRVIAARDIDPAQRTALTTAFMIRYHDAHALTKLYPGVPEALAALAKAGHPLGICTNKPLEPTHTALRHFGLDKLMKTVVGGDSLPQKKPDPAPLRLAMEQMGVTAARPSALYVGDSEFDAHCAAAVPVPFLIFSGGYRKTPISELPHQQKFDHFSELPNLVAAALLV